jgi:hypothetical protein
MVTEPLVSKRGKLVSINNGKVFYDSNKYRACIITDPRLNAWAVPQFSSPDMATCCVTIKNRDIYLTSVYMDINNPNPPAKLDLLLEHCRSSDRAIVVSTDSNAHSELWQSDETNERGDMIEAIMFRYNLTLHNRGETLTYFGGNGSSIIDLTFTNNLISNCISNWRVDLTASMSDHRYVCFEMDADIPADISAVNIKKADWPVFRGVINKHINDLLEDNSFDSAIALDRIGLDAQQLIQYGLDRSCLTKKPFRGKDVPWWDDELEELNIEVKAMYKKMITHKCTREEYREVKSKYNNLIKSSKSISWNKFCSEIESDSTCSKMMKLLSSNKNEIGFIKDSNGAFTTTPSETLTVLMDTHFPGNLAKELIPDDVKPTEWTNSTAGVEFITPEVVRNIFAGFGPTKGPGPDGFSPIVLQNLPDTMI